MGTVDCSRAGLRFDGAVFRAVYARDGFRLSRESPAIGRVQRAAELAGCVLILMAWLWMGDLLAAVLGLGGVLLTQVVLVLLPTAAYAAASGGVVRELGLHRAGITVFGQSFGLGLTMSVITSHLALWQARWLWLDPVEAQAMTQLTEAVTEAPGLAVLALVLAPAIAEESLFRGLVLGRLRRRFGVGMAVGVSALLFALIHRSPMRFLPPLVLGLVLGVVRVASGSAVAAMLLHFAYNLAILGFSLDWVREPSSRGHLVGALAVSIWLVWKLRSRLENSRHNSDPRESFR